MEQKTISAEKLITSAKEYLEKNCQTKKVILPSGSVFEIKTITGRDYLSEINLPIKSSKEISLEDPEKAKEYIRTAPPEKQKEIIEANSRVIIKATINPQLSLIETPGKLCIDKLTDEDYYSLLKEITDFSLGGRENLKSFRKEPVSNAPGLDGTTIQDSSDSYIKPFDSGITD